MRYEVLFKIHPDGIFGLPEEGMSIVPGGTKVTTASFNPIYHDIVEYGTLSKYRETPLEFDARIGTSGPLVRVRDNILRFQLDAADDNAAIETGIALANRFCTLLSCYDKNYFSVALVGGIQIGQKPFRNIPRPVSVTLMSVRGYGLTDLLSHITQACTASAFNDPALEKASAYFYHAVFERDQRNDSIAQGTIDPGSIHAKLITAEVCLNCYKAVSTILGDASVDKDYQSRYRKFGMATQLWKDAEKLRDLRNDFDVAHYTTDWGPLDAIQGQENFAIVTAQQVITDYVKWLSRSAA